MERAAEHHHGDSHPAASGHRGHDKHAGHSVEMFRNRFWACLVLTLPALIWEPMLQEWFGYRAPAVPGAAWIPAVFGTAVFFYGGWVFLEGARRELLDRQPGMMTLMGLAISVAFVYSAPAAETRPAVAGTGKGPRSRRGMGGSSELLRRARVWLPIKKTTPSRKLASVRPPRRGFCCCGQPGITRIARLTPLRCAVTLVTAPCESRQWLLPTCWVLRG